MSLLNQNGTKEGRLSRKMRSSNVRELDFSRIGGLQHHLNTLRDLIIIPLIHGHVFAQFRIKPAKGVIFYGPPGTGKTLVAGALAAEINKEGIGKVSFFQRKGADILDKWVGGSEKNLRDLFEKASRCRPSIIFFDELDGLAPVRSDRNDHVHASVVATLLALMDGLDCKPGVIVIGATNRLETIDPALRRSGRFDKELYFPLPSYKGRKEIIQVHTISWKTKPSVKFVSRLAELTSGFSGADIQAMCAEAVMCCLKRSHRQVIEQKGCVKKIDAETLKVEEKDFLDARKSLTPFEYKQSGHVARELSSVVRPLLSRQLSIAISYIQRLWPHFLQEDHQYVLGENRYAGRILLVGQCTRGLNTHLVPAIMKRLEHLPQVVYDTRIFEMVKGGLVSVKPHCPGVVLLSRVDEWWEIIDECDRHSIMSNLDEIHAEVPILTIASCRNDVPATLHNFFYTNSTVMIRVSEPTEEEKETFFAPLFFDDKISSVYRIWERTKKPLRKTTKGKTPLIVDADPNADEVPAEETCSRRKRKREAEGDANTEPQVRGRKKDNVAKKVKLCESKYGPLKSNSTSNIYDLRRPIKTEGPSNCRSCTSLDRVNPKRYFTRVLSDLLNQRRQNFARGADSTTLDVKRACNMDEVRHFNAMGHSRRDMQDENMRQIYTLWKHAALVTGRDMPLALLELLYDVIWACLQIHQNSFDDVIENLKFVLRQVEHQYQMTAGCM